MKKSICVVTPCFNEEDSIRDCYNAVREIFEQHLQSYERFHLICDNASTDGTVDILRELASEDPHLKIILNARNFGPMRSHFNGVKNADGDATLLFLPADLQDPPDLIPEFVKLWEQGYEVVFGIRADREEGLIMTFIRKLYYHLISGATYLDMPPNVGDFQLIDRKVLNTIKLFDDKYPFVRAMTFEVGFKKVGIPYTCRARTKGTSKNRFFHLIDQGLNGLISFSSFPIRTALAIGVILSAVSIIYAIINAIMYFTPLGDGVPRGTTLMITALFFFAGVQLFFMGFIGEYVLSIFNQVRNRPLVVERERINFKEEVKQDWTESPKA